MVTTKETSFDGKDGARITESLSREGSGNNKQVQKFEGLFFPFHASSKTSESKEEIDVDGNVYARNGSVPRMRKKVSEEGIPKDLCVRSMHVWRWEGTTKGDDKIRGFFVDAHVLFVEIHAIPMRFPTVSVVRPDGKELPRSTRPQYVPGSQQGRDQPSYTHIGELPRDA